VVDVSHYLQVIIRIREQVNTDVEVFGEDIEIRIQIMSIVNIKEL